MANQAAPNENPTREPFWSNTDGRIRLSRTYERLGLAPAQRLVVFGLSSYFMGATLGLAQGGRQAALRFRAENSHRLPKNQRGWYFYHKAKHAYVALDALSEAHKVGKRVAPWTVLLIAVEEAVDTMRLDQNFDDTRKDFMSTTVAAVTSAGVFSLWNKFPVRTAARTVRLGLVGGLSLGSAQDGLRLVRGHELAYVELIKHKLGYGGPGTGAKV